MTTAADFRLPGTTHRTLIVGRTGSGKTQFGANLLAASAWDRQPYIIINYKHDALLNDIPNVQDISVSDKKLPKHPGLYMVHPLPEKDDEQVEGWLWRIWKQGRIGLFADEAYNLPDKGALQAILTQGRSKHIPAIICTQRPVWLSRFCFSEADFIAVFHLNDERDQQTIRKLAPPTMPRERLPPYECYWYDVGGDHLFHLQKAPDAPTILDTFKVRAARRRRTI